MYIITQEQANALYEFAKNKTVKGERFNRLLAEIAMHVKTNGDRIRSMTDEKLAQEIMPRRFYINSSDMLKWLKQEAKENEMH